MELIVFRETPTRSASCAWESFYSLRVSFSLFLNISLSFICPCHFHHHNPQYQSLRSGTKKKHRFLSAAAYRFISNRQAKRCHTYCTYMSIPPFCTLLCYPLAAPVFLSHGSLLSHFDCHHYIIPISPVNVPDFPVISQKNGHSPHANDRFPIFCHFFFLRIIITTIMINAAPNSKT